MRIGFDARCLQTASAGGGVGRYARGLLDYLPPPGDELLAYVSAHRPAPAIGESAGRRVVRLNRPSKGITLWDPFAWPGRLRRDRVDVFHSPFYGVPTRRPRNTTIVATVHDLIPILFEDAVTPRQRLIFGRHFARALTAHRIIVPSLRTLKDLVDLLGAEPTRITVIPLGLEERFHAACSAVPSPDERRRRAEAARGRLATGRPYILNVGGFDPTKELGVLLEAFGRVSANRDDLALVVCGGTRNEKARAFMAAVKKAGLEERVIFPGRLEDAELVEAYAGAELFAFPSRYEGFGLPPLEAMACGCPVVASTGGSLGEVLAGAAVLAPPGDAVGLAEGVERVLSEEGLRDKLVAAGLAHAGKYRWEEAARRTVEVYRDGLDQVRGGSYPAGREPE
jgi:glycosyltransferase involved in cell wall biosynthesis